MKQQVKKAVLAYSGGLDTSIIIPWLRENYGCDVIALVSNAGQPDSLNRIEEKALTSGASKVIVEDLRHEFVTGYLWPLVRSGAGYEGSGLLGAAIVRPLIAKRQVEIALQEGADALVHGCDGCNGWVEEGGDSCRFEFSYNALAPGLKVIAPRREWNIRSREDAIAYAGAWKIPLPAIEESSYRRDSNLWHCSHRGGILDDLDEAPPPDLYELTLEPSACPGGESEITIDFDGGVPVGLNGLSIPPVQLIEDLNEIAGTNGIGRADRIENRAGTKTRVIDETPAGTLIMAAHRELESVVFDRSMRHHKDTLALTYAQHIDEGHWFSPLREALDAFFAKANDVVTGSVTMSLYKGNLTVKSRRSPHRLYPGEYLSFERSSPGQPQAVRVQT